MKSEKEIREMHEKLNNNKSIKELDEEGFVNYTDKGGHWSDCLDWVLTD